MKHQSLAIIVMKLLIQNSLSKDDHIYQLRIYLDLLKDVPGTLQVST